MESTHNILNVDRDSKIPLFCFCMVPHLDFKAEFESTFVVFVAVFRITMHFKAESYCASFAFFSMLDLDLGLFLFRIVASPLRRTTIRREIYNCKATLPAPPAPAAACPASRAMLP